jgi:ribosomal protein S18 acetylase RimI-like enzyme
MELRRASFKDLDLITRCQMMAFPDALSTKLGKAYVKKMLEWYLTNDRGLLLIIKSEVDIIGFIGCIYYNNNQQTGAATLITQYTFLNFLGAILSRPWLLFNYDLLIRYKFIFRNILVRIGFSKYAKIGPIISREKFINRLGLVVIGIEPRFQGQGYISPLMQYFERTAVAIGAKEVTLSVKKNNLRALKAYKKQNWTIFSESKDSYALKKILI